MRGQIFPKLFLHHRFVIGPVADVHFGDGVAFEDDEVGADAVEESKTANTDSAEIEVVIVLIQYHWLVKLARYETNT